jgi:hypothetical protein
MSTHDENKVVWSIRVSPALKQWFVEFSKDRCTDPQEEARRALADFREHMSNNTKLQITDIQRSQDGQAVPLRDSGKE